VSSEWTCYAEGNVATAPAAGGSWSNSRTSIPGTGKTRDAAYYKAFSDCNALMTTGTTIAMAGGQRTQSDVACHVTRCIAPGQSIVR
jgi:hypothetical protein